MIIFYTCAHINEKHRIILFRKSLDFCCYINVSFFLLIFIMILYIMFHLIKASDMLKLIQSYLILLCIYDWDMWEVMADIKGWVKGGWVLSVHLASNEVRAEAANPIIRPPLSLFPIPHLLHPFFNTTSFPPPTSLSIYLLSIYPSRSRYVDAAVPFISFCSNSNCSINWNLFHPCIYQSCIFSIRISYCF